MLVERPALPLFTFYDILLKIGHSFPSFLKDTTKVGFDTAIFVLILEAITRGHIRPKALESWANTWVVHVQGWQMSTKVPCQIWTWAGQTILRIVLDMNSALGYLKSYVFRVAENPCLSYNLSIILFIISIYCQPCDPFPLLFVCNIN